ncbi:kinase-like protein [Setomelanomma holmii]|uniref:Kinase-like protein n=1 Tax=Setomelanomma holmii TaxID=210430 RepID=A0A9P4LSU0_9PLEO|nr:kinase-like protein [Setomelanomma holmii]
MPLFSSPQAFRLRDTSYSPPTFVAMGSQSFDYGGNGFIDVFRKKHSSHPDFANLTLLVFEAVMEVVCVSLPGYIIARMGQFDAESQKFLANLNTQLFTPFFTKLASQLTADKLSDLAVIPLIFIVQTLVSYLAAILVSKICGFKKRASNFLIAMAVFGNSNSLPISLVISLSKTLSGLHWDKVPGDNDNEVAARGILYLLIFQQLGQLVRWTWGFNVLLAPASAYTEEDGGKNSALENGEYDEDEVQNLLGDSHSGYYSGDITSYETSAESSDVDSLLEREDAQADAEFSTPTNGNIVVRGNGVVNGHLENGHANGNGTLKALKSDIIPKGIKGWPKRAKNSVLGVLGSISGAFSRAGRSFFQSLPSWLQTALSKVGRALAKFLSGVWAFMNPPLWAMLVAILIASVPKLQHLFFDPGTFVSNSVTRAVNQSGQVAVPLILVVLGANLARNTLPKEDQHSMEDPKTERTLVIASLVSRMLIPTLFMAPMLALTAKYVPVSILDDPIFIIVCFLLSGAPTALQLAQICQINNVYMGAMSRILFQSYVVREMPTMASSNEGSSRANQNEAPTSAQSNSVEESTSPRPAPKVVTFPDESISPLMIGKQKELDQKDYLDLDKTARQYPTSVSRKRLQGRPSVERLASYKSQGAEGNPSLTSLLSESSADTHGHHDHHGLLKQVSAWIKHERARRSARRAKRKGAAIDVAEDSEPVSEKAESVEQSAGTRTRSGSESSQGSVALDQLANILEKTLAIKPADTKRKYSHVRKLSVGLKRHSVVSADSDYFESVDQLVPNCEAILDNSKTMAYTLEGGEIEPVTEKSEKKARKEKEAWDTFKFEILRIAHTLKLKGWRKVPMELSEHMDVQRLSGALTNAVYVVSPPKDLSLQGETQDGPPKPRNPPPKLLLRIYGPQVEHLIDRESELKILQRLARKRIGPRLLGTFTNGRFEEFLHAKALTAKDLRQTDTSKQIAKRMRELHEGIDLLKEEREAGPFVWQNWDKWVQRCEQVVTWLDQQILECAQDSLQNPADKWKKRGFVCGVEWPVFRATIEKYRKWLEDQYGGVDKINERLVFAHNDTQYGNILRMVPEGESPLLLPANKHKQLVVIDFEYANANLPGLEFANHFTEWTYNYHDPDYSWKCNHKYYPSLEEQHRFIHAYLLHTPSYRAPGASASNPSTPNLGPLPTSGSTTALAATAAPNTITEFMLDSRAPPGEKYSEQEAQRERQTEEEARRLMAETKLWRLANSAMWVAWGIVQAHVPGLPDFDAEEKRAQSNANETAAELESATTEMRAEAEAEEKKKQGTVSQEKADEKDDVKTTTEQETDIFKSQEEEEFDYLAYAQDRAMFLWGDAIRMGMIKAEELPVEVQQKVKMVEY